MEVGVRAFIKNASVSFLPKFPKLQISENITEYEREYAYNNN